MQTFATELNNPWLVNTAINRLDVNAADETMEQAFALMEITWDDF